MTTFSNYALEWEETSITNIGLDFGVLNNRLNGTIEVYDKKTDGILYRPTLPESLNQFTSPLQNLQVLTTKGLKLLWVGMTVSETSLTRFQETLLIIRIK